MKVIKKTIENYQCDNCNYVNDWEDDTRIHEFSCVGKGKDYILKTVKNKIWYRIPNLEIYELFEKTIEFWNVHIPEHFPIICNFENRTLTTVEEEIKSRQDRLDTHQKFVDEINKEISELKSLYK